MISLSLVKLFSITILETWNFHGCSGFQLKHGSLGAQDYHQDMYSASGIESLKTSPLRGSFQEGLCDMRQPHYLGHTQNPSHVNGGINDPGNPHQVTTEISGIYIPEQGHTLSHLDCHLFDHQEIYWSTFKNLNSVNNQRTPHHFESMSSMGGTSGTQEITDLYTTHDDFLLDLDKVPLHLQAYDSDYLEKLGSGQPYEHSGTSEENLFLSRDFIPFEFSTENFLLHQDAVRCENEQQPQHLIDAMQYFTDIDPWMTKNPPYHRVENPHQPHLREQTINLTGGSQQLSTPHTAYYHEESFTHSQNELLENSWLQDICPELYGYPSPDCVSPESHIPETGHTEINVKSVNDKTPEDRTSPISRDNLLMDNTDTILKKNIEQDQSNQDLQGSPVETCPHKDIPNKTLPIEVNLPSLKNNHLTKIDSNIEIHEKTGIENEPNSNQKKKRKGILEKTGVKLPRISNKRSKTTLKADHQKLISQMEKPKFFTKLSENDHDPSSSKLDEDSPCTFSRMKTAGKCRLSGLSESLNAGNLERPGRARRKFKTAQSIGMMNVNRSPTLSYEIFDWFQEIYEGIRPHCKEESEIKALGCAIKNAGHGIVMAFLGILKTFEYDESGKDNLQLLLDDGWNYMKKVFSHWKVAKPEDFGFGMPTKYIQDSDILSPGWQMKYLKGVSAADAIPFTMIVYLARMWSQEKGSLRVPQDVKLERLAATYEMDDSSAEGGLYSRRGVRNEVFWGGDQFSKIHWYFIWSPGLPLPNDSGIIYNLAQFHTNVGRGMCKTVHIFFEKLIHDLTGRYKEMNEGNVHTSINGIDIPDKLHLVHSSNIDLIVQAVSVAQYKVTVPYVGAIRAFYESSLSEEELEILLMHAWIFLNGLYSKWLELNFQPTNLSQLFSMKSSEIFKSARLDDPEYMFQVHFSFNKYRTPKKLVLYLLGLWSKTIKKKQYGLQESHRLPVIGFPLKPFEAQSISKLIQR
ncbi:uncharacterized protein MELLADRAFT_61386 [Melampsora larici-populina 98AG31]|uniref:Family 48 glycoside hydrolase n=1 Tax=Melampsora larici-populina (strain 98AG31 / pathotype 3-4-7) TaxID=747676 RepID=F4REP9_MELLP|nr:uncharacterized protein MELLADRAFT_61386 [Melampsora larici-populina 98AG31]EGG09138.1 hypothetical protein MELLADRAFT_61386 [Melampsora larici-populina 98AG31]